jgi:hypothetical protein
MSKALMDAEADAKVAERKEKLEGELDKKKKEKAAKLKDSQFPDIFSKPQAAQFEEINISEDTKKKA